MDNKFQDYLARNQKTIGFIGATLAIIMFVSLIEVFISNLNGQSKIIIQPLATAINGFVWVLYAYGRKDYFLLVPNALALIIGAMTAIVVFV